MHPDLDAFLTAKSAAGLSSGTIHWYATLLGQFLEWAACKNLETKKPETVEGYLSSLRLRRLSPFTISDCHRALVVYFKWLCNRNLVGVSPMTLVQRPKLPKSRKRHVTLEQFEILYSSINGTDWLDYRDRSILLLLFYSGPRASELLGLSLACLDREQRIIHINGGKGDRDRDVPYSPALLPELDTYLALCPLIVNEHLFVTAKGLLSYGGLSQMVRRRCEQAAMPRLGLHSFRHGFAMMFLNLGEMELGAVSKTLGHSSVDLTRRFYADFETSSLVRRYDKAFGKLRSTA